MSIEKVDNGRLRATPRLVVGLAIALFGLVLVLDRLNLVVAGRILRFWPAVLIVVGVMMFVRTRRVGGGVNGIIVTLIGGWLLLNSIGTVQVRFWEMFWPIVLIAIGSALVMQTVRHRDASASPDSDDTVTIFAVMSGTKRRSSAARFRGGEVTLFMGGGQIDLRQATIPYGEEAVLDIVAVMGGCELVVPSSWTVATPIVPIMGAVEDKRLPPLPDGNIGAAGGLAAPRLVLRGFVMMGGVEIKS
jgi:predicted membrane protein